MNTKKSSAMIASGIQKSRLHELLQVGARDTQPGRLSSAPHASCLLTVK